MDKPTSNSLPRLISAALILVIVLLVGIYIGVYQASSTPEEPDTSVDGSPALAQMGRFIFLPLNNPGVVLVKDATHMRDDDIVAGLVVGDQARAYPQWILVGYHVVNDTINGSPVLLAHCEICSGAGAFEPVLEMFGGDSLSFQIHGIARGTFSIYDYQTNSIWSPFSGHTVEGKLHPSRLKRIPIIMEPWKQWKERYPDTEVVVGHRRMITTRKHGRGDHNTLGHHFIPSGMKKTANLSDKRLPRNAMVFGVTSGDKNTVFPFKILKGLSKHTFNNNTYIITRVGQFGIAAFKLKPEQRNTDFTIASTTPFRISDGAGGSWDIFGRSNNDGDALEPADGYVTEWYEWASSFPDTAVSGQEAP